jgi:hypothetical protein
MSRVRQEHFPLLVREKLVRELLVFNFHGMTRSLCQFIKEVSDAAEFLQYTGNEGRS